MNDATCNNVVPNRSGFLYFIQSGDGGAVKVGWTVDIWERVATLQLGNPIMLRPIAWFEMSCPQDAEAKIHRDLAVHRVIGEWFAWSPAIDVAIEWARTCSERHPPVRDPERERRKVHKLSGRYPRTNP